MELHGNFLIEYIKTTNWTSKKGYGVWAGIGFVVDSSADGWICKANITMNKASDSFRCEDINKNLISDNE
jgi:hypothetical protein